MSKPDLVISAVSGYGWDQLRPFVVSLAQSGFSGDAVLLANNISTFAADCARARDFIVIPFSKPHSPTFVIKDRFVPLLQFLESDRHYYRSVIWVDAGDQIFQRNPSEWLDQYAKPGEVIAARECWRIKDETQFNDPWVKAALPNDYSWLREEEVLCGGTVAGDAEAVYRALRRVYDLVCEKPIWGSDQAFLNYVLRRDGFETFVPSMQDGWTATCSAFDTAGFHSPIGREAASLTDAVPVFDQSNQLVLTPDGKKPFVLVHQYNRDSDWLRIMHTKYRD